MKIIQSFWSGNQTNINSSYGWLAPRFNWLSWILSSHQLVKYHQDVELYTDKFGYEILIEKLKLPYTKVHVVLDELNHYNKDLWAIAKVKTFQMQNEPFLHVDGDVFVWESLTDIFKNSALITQNLEITTDYYGSMWADISPNLVFLPREMDNYNGKISNRACNMGIIGGNDIPFFKEYTEKSIEFVDKNFSNWSKINSFNFNVFFEQVLFHEMATEKNKRIDFLFNEVREDNSYVGFGDFHLVPQKTYLHLLGVFKRNIQICKAMEVYILKNYPESYTNFSKLFNEVNNTNSEIDFLTESKVEELKNEFDFEIRNNIEISENYLLKRDIYNDGSYTTLENYFFENKDFHIIKSSGFIFTTDIVEGEPMNMLKIDEINADPSVFVTDHIDELIIEELSQPIKYFDLIENMKKYLESDDEESMPDFIQLLNMRLKDYFLAKTITIYH